VISLDVSTFEKKLFLTLNCVVTGNEFNECLAICKMNKS